MARGAPGEGGALVIACGALAREILALCEANGWAGFAVQCLPAELHNRPQAIPEAVRAEIRKARPDYRSIFVAYGDCGTGGALDAVLAEEGAERIPGAHCYEFFAGSEHFEALAAAEPGTFYVTDFLARHFDRLVIKGLGIDRRPQLTATYFANYRRLVYLAQSYDSGLERMARMAASRLGLQFELQRTGYGALGTALADFNGRAVTWHA